MTGGAWIAVVRTGSGSVDALIMLYALVRAFSFTGSNRYMRLSLATLATVLTYSQFELITAPVPLTSRTYVGWIGSAITLVLFWLAVRADTGKTPRRRRNRSERKT